MFENDSHVKYNLHKHMLLRFLLLVGLGFLKVSVVQAQTGLLVTAHGAGPEWNARVRETVAQVTWTKGPVATAFLMGAEAQTAGWDSAVARLSRDGAREVIVVPFMVSSFGSHYRQIRFYAGELDELPSELAAHDHSTGGSAGLPMGMTAALDDAPELGAVLLDRWRALEAVARGRPLILVAHGPTTDAEARRWVANLKGTASGIANEGRIPVEIGLLRDDAPPPVRAAAIAKIHGQVRALLTSPADSVTVMPVLISTGRIDRVTIPNDLAGLPVRYAPMVLTPHAELARWIERVAIARLNATP
jgi:sirohydrochlorin ferrochelatase